MPDTERTPAPANFVVGSNYQVLDVIGEGAYGIVCSALHVPSQRKVAIKRISPFDHSMFCLRTLREIKLLRHFHHENIISILDILKPPSLAEFREVYLVQELMETDLHRVIRTQELSDDHCQYFIYQTLRALKALHSADVLHRDLKPSNLLLNANCDLKLSIILDVLGTPSLDDFYAITSQRSREYIRALPFRKKKPFNTLFPNANPLALDLMEKCLTFSPKRRIEVEEALKHPYLEAYHDPQDEPTAEPLDPLFFDFDYGDPLGKERLKGTSFVQH
ncbi:uncharacterized protein FIBRA_00755 [Fibroporia radiculosa]|uniref:Mitogen-activated protein kinase n=1 Tax=Fibroporia radiculosa TaxID=599839 RepID=J4GII3_9APHY|nr:uncharacterized protein FIBRA_00755 [Fibroporia radiculosa]CCL98750.1 predicted protein [Fibroporia radiculosa]